MTARVWNPREDVWIVRWSDGTLTLENSESDARLCEQYPELCHPRAWNQMLAECALGEGRPSA